MQRLKFFSGWLASLCLYSLLAVPSTQAAIPEHVFISEVAWAGSSLSASDEWIELANPTQDTIDLSGWQLSGAASSGTILTLPEGSSLAPQSTFLIANYEATHENAALTITPSYVTSSISLSNSALQITLTNTQGEIMDLIGNSSVPLAGTSGGTSAGGAYVSMERLFPVSDGSLPEAWTTATTQIGVKDGVPDLATPGFYAFDTISEETSGTQTETSVDTVAETPSEEVLETTEVESVETESDTPEEIIEEPVVEIPLEIEPTTPLLFISEFVSDPSEGSVEFIELYNNSDLPLDLTGYTIRDTAGKITTLEGMISSKSYFLVPEPSGKLNNDEDAIILANTSEIILETVVYGTDDLPALSDPYAYAKTEGGVFVATTTPTPGEINIFTTEIPETITEETSESVMESTTEETVTEAESTTESSETSYVSYQSGDLLINEFISSPLEGESEWVELFSLNTDFIDLAGWTFEDATGKQTFLGEGTLSPESYLIIPSPKGVLNNGGDTLVLKDGQGNVIDTLIYGTSEIYAPSKGFSLARTSEGIWQETETTTPGMVNVFTHQEETTSTEASPADVTGSQEETTASVSYDYASLRLSEVYPNTKGSDEAEEFIEMENIGEEAIDLCGVILEDTSGKQYVFSDHQLLANVGLFSVPRSLSGIALNNLKETVFLYDPSHQLLDQVSYEKSTQGQSLARISGSWNWTANPTENEPNTFPNPQVDDTRTAPATDHFFSAPATTTTSVSVDRTHTTSGYSLKTIAQAQDLPDDAQIQVTGIVSAIPGALGKQIFYLQDETGGIQIYQYRSDFPDLQEGDGVSVQGTMSTNRDERRIKISGKEDVTLTQTSSPLMTQELVLSEISEEYAGILISVSGIVVSKENTSVVLEENGIQLTVRLASSTGLTTGDFPTGASMTVTGILTKNDDTLTLLPRSAEDIQIISQTTEEPLVSGLSMQEQTSRRIALTLTLVACAALAGFALFHYAPRIKSYVTHRPVRVGT